MNQQVEADLSWGAKPIKLIIRYIVAHKPQWLKTFHSPPPVLFVVGDRALLAQSQLAMVGSRTPTAYGLRNAYMLASQLVEQGFHIVSGLARGIDKAAHQGALSGCDFKCDLRIRLNYAKCKLQ